MIRLLLLAWCHLVLLAMARGESVERAYYLGSRDSLFNWANSGGGEDDPFATENLWESKRNAVRLENVLLESEFISKGDKLWDVSSEFKAPSDESDQFEVAIFNETTGQLILRGKKERLDRIDGLLRGLIKELPRMVQLKVQLFHVPMKGWGVSQWKGEELAEKHPVLIEGETVTRIGQQTIFKAGNGALELKFEPQVGSLDGLIDLGLEVSGKAKGHSFDFSTGVTCFVGIPAMIELGGIGGEKTMILSLTPEIVLVDGVILREAVLEAGKPVPSPRDQLVSHSAGQRLEPDPETGKVFRNFQVPPTFLRFIDPGGAREGDADPFAEDASAEQTRHYSYVKEWNSKVIAYPGARVVDIRDLLKFQGIEFLEGDFAYFVEDSAIVYAETSLDHMYLLEAIIGGHDWNPPRMIPASFVLLQGDRKIEADDLDRDDLRCLLKGGLVARPGQNSPLVLKHGLHSFWLETEMQVGANDDFIDMRTSMKWLDGNEILFEWLSGITLTSGKRQIVSSFSQDGKWYALVVEARVEEMVDWLLGSE